MNKKCTCKCSHCKQMGNVPKIGGWPPIDYTDGTDDYGNPISPPEPWTPDQLDI